MVQQKRRSANGEESVDWDWQVNARVALSRDRVACADDLGINGMAWPRERRKKVCVDLEPSSLVGHRVKVWWDGSKEAFTGTVQSFDSATWEHKVRYDDGDVCDELLVLERVMVPRTRGPTAAQWPRPTQAQLEGLAAALVQKAEEAERGSTPVGGRRARATRNVEGAHQAKALRQCAQAVSDRADQYEEEERALQQAQAGQGQGQQQQAQAQGQGQQQQVQVQGQGQQQQEHAAGGTSKQEPEATKRQRRATRSGSQQLEGAGAGQAEVKGDKQEEVQPGVGEQEHAAVGTSKQEPKAPKRLRRATRSESQQLEGAGVEQAETKGEKQEEVQPGAAEQEHAAVGTSKQESEASKRQRRATRSASQQLEGAGVEQAETKGGKQEEGQPGAVEQEKPGKGRASRRQRSQEKQQQPQEKQQQEQQQQQQQQQETQPSQQLRRRSSNASALPAAASSAKVLDSAAPAPASVRAAAAVTADGEAAPSLQGKAARRVRMVGTVGAGQAAVEPPAVVMPAAASAEDATAVAGAEPAAERAAGKGKRLRPVPEEASSQQQQQQGGDADAAPTATAAAEAAGDEPRPKRERRQPRRPDQTLPGPSGQQQAGIGMTRRQRALSAGQAAAAEQPQQQQPLLGDVAASGEAADGIGAAAALAPAGESAGGGLAVALGAPEAPATVASSAPAVGTAPSASPAAPGVSGRRVREILIKANDTRPDGTANGWQPSQPAPAAAPDLGAVAPAVAVGGPLQPQQQQQLLPPQPQAEPLPRTGQIVVDTYQDTPELLNWVMGAPDADSLARFATWAERLSAVISDVPLPNMPPGTRLLPVQEALDILWALEQHPVSLGLLEGTQVCKAVAMLRSHRCLSIAQQAAHLAQTWRAMAVAALQRANAAMTAGPKRGGKKQKEAVM